MMINSPEYFFCACASLCPGSVWCETVSRSVCVRITVHVIALRDAALVRLDTTVPPANTVSGRLIILTVRIIFAALAEICYYMM